MSIYLPTINNCKHRFSDNWPIKSLEKDDTANRPFLLSLVWHYSTCRNIYQMICFSCRKSTCLLPIIQSLVFCFLSTFSYHFYKLLYLKLLIKLITFNLFSSFNVGSFHIYIIWIIKQTHSFPNTCLTFISIFLINPKGPPQLIKSIKFLARSCNFRDCSNWGGP